jgi:succinate dehydrogenase/fumarate reductase flavoprotein subunit
MKNLIIMLFSFGGLAGIALLVSNYMGGSFKITDMIHKLFQKKGQENILEIEKKQDTVMEKVMESEKVAEETKTKIKDIRKKANKDIVEILQKDNVEDILVGDDELWN